MIEFKNYEEGRFDVYYFSPPLETTVGNVTFDDVAGKWFYEDYGHVVLDSDDLRIIADKLDELGYAP